MHISTASVVFIFVICRFRFTFTALQSNDIRNNLGTRTPYRFKFNKNDSILTYPNCIDSKIWMMTRHGTRLPSAKDIIGMNTTLMDLKFEILLKHKLGKGELTKSQIKVLEEWSSNLDVDREKYLTREGQDEMIMLAERMAKRFPNAIKDTYDNQSFYFRYTATERAQQSARYFTLGLFQKKDSMNVVFQPTSKVDPVLRFYKHCDKWQKQVKKNPDTYEEQTLFGNSRQMIDTLAMISKRLGLSRNLKLDEANLMYKVCGFETAWSKHKVSPWCFAFDRDSAEKLEYYHDIKHYWLDGYGHNLTYRQACMSIKNMFNNFIDENSSNATFLFAHSGTLLKILAHLQLYKPEEHLRGNFVPIDRPWRASDIDCFASNIAFVLYKCVDQNYVLMLHQERIIKLPLCDQELCPLNHLMQVFHDSVFNCDYTDMCRLD